MTPQIKGILAMVGACTVWGLSPLYYAQLAHVPPLEVLSYRGLWSLGFFAVVLIAQRRIALVFSALSNWRSFAIIAVAAVMISANWFGFIFAISTGQGVEASLGYYIFPLVAVLIGRAVFAESLLAAQWIAVSMAAIAVTILTVGLGVAPWIALALALTFGAYGLVKKQLDLGPVVSVTAEVLVLAPFAVWWIIVKGTGVGGGNAGATHALLALSGPLTATPLILFSYAARRIRLSTIGLVQYLNPTLQFCCAVFVMSEPFTKWHAIAFPIIWLALVVYSLAALRQERAVRKRSSSVSTSGTAVTKSSMSFPAKP